MIRVGRWRICGDSSNRARADRQPGDDVVLLRTNRAGAGDALVMPVRKALATVFDRLHDDPSVRAVALTGNERRSQQTRRRSLPTWPRRSCRRIAWASAWFAEGFDAADLRDARELLDDPAPSALIEVTT